MPPLPPASPCRVSRDSGRAGFVGQPLSAGTQGGRLGACRCHASLAHMCRLQVPQDHQASPSSCGTAPPSPSTGPAETRAKGPSPATSSRPGRQVRPPGLSRCPYGAHVSLSASFPSPSACCTSVIVTCDGARVSPGEAQVAVGVGSREVHPSLRNTPEVPREQHLAPAEDPLRWGEGRSRSQGSPSRWAR